MERLPRQGAGLRPAVLHRVDVVERGDGILDLAVLNADSGDLSVLSGTGGGAFRPRLTMPLGRYPTSIAVAGLMLWRGIEAVSFLGGLWIGATLIQLYFHEFHVPVPQDRAAPPVVSPIKSMSYAIQDSPWRPWRELLTLTVLIGLSLVLLV